MSPRVLRFAPFALSLAAVAAPDMSGFAAMDANKDGRISDAEHATAARKMFIEMDADKDGKVTAAEMDAAHMKVTGKKPRKGDKSAAEKIRAIDTDGDGMLTAEEHGAGARKIMVLMDTDKDGYLSPAELQAGQASMLKK
jgi:hypothetical protein